jgi:small subunit ribosomal protein S17
MSRRVLHGKVVSAAGDKTVVVRVDRRVKHPAYKKYILRSKKYAAHDAGNRCELGDAVRIRESRPLSKTKRWEVIVDAEKGGGARAKTGAKEGAAS